MKISGYTTSRNCVSLDYPLRECIESLKQFCDEIVIADSTDTEDGTRELLQELVEGDSRIKVYHNDLDYSAPNHGVFDGQQKAFARSKCTGDWLWQTDLDEIVHENDVSKIRSLCEKMPETVNLIALPVVEYWGGLEKVRIDVNVWKWRLSRNLPHITHGIPGSLRVIKNGLLYSKPGSDGCDYVDKTTGNPIQFVNFITQQTEALRFAAIRDQRYVPHYEQWFNDAVDQLPGVFHFSWLSIERKIKAYKSFWNNHWRSMYGEELSSDNLIFDVPWEQVTDEMIKAKAKELREGTTGWVFHRKWDGSRNNHVTINRSVPAIIQEWAKNHEDK